MERPDQSARKATPPATKADITVTMRILKELAKFPDRRVYVALMCRTLDLGSDDAEHAIRLGVDRGWLIPDGDPAGTVGLTKSGSSIAGIEKV